MKKFLFVLGFLVLAVVLAPFWLGLIFRDIQLTDTSDLQVQWDVPEVNAYDALIQLNDEESDIFEILDEAAEADGYLEPGLAEGLDLVSAIPTVTGLPNAVRASIERAKDLLNNDEEDAAIAELERTLQVVQMYQDAPGALIQQLIALTGKQLVLEAIYDMSLAIDLSDYSNYESSSVQALKVEFMLVEAFVGDVGEMENDLLEGKGLWFETSYYFHPNETIGTFAEGTRFQIKEMQKSCDEGAEDLIVETTPDFLFFTENAIGKSMVEMLSPRISSFHRKICELEALTEAIGD